MIINQTVSSGKSKDKIYSAVSASATPANTNGYIEATDWENKIGDSVVFINIAGGEINGFWANNKYYYSPFVCVSATHSNNVYTVEVKDKNNETFSVNFIDECVNFTEYNTLFGINNNSRILAPIHPKVGDKVPVYNANGYSRTDIINGMTVPDYSSANKFSYFGTSGNVSVSGPITIKDVQYMDGKYCIYLQDANGNKLSNMWKTPIQTKEITVNGEYETSSYEKVNVNVELPKSENPELNPCAIELENGEICVRNIEESTLNFIAWDSQNGNTYYTYNITLDNYLDIKVYDSWTFTNEISSAQRIYFGGVVINDILYYYAGLEQPFGEESIYRNLDGDEFNVQGYEIPDVGTQLTPGTVTKSLKSSIKTPVAIEAKEGYGNIFFYDFYDSYGHSIRYSSPSYDERQTKDIFFGPSGSSFLWDNMGNDYVIRSYYLGFYSEDTDSKYVYGGETSGNFAIFTNGESSVYVDPSNFVEGGIFYYDPSDLSNTGTISYMLQAD